MRTGCGFHGTRKPALLSGVCGTALLLGFSFATPASAQVAAWTGATSTDWTDASNWSGGIAPIPGQTVNIGAVGASRPDAILGVGGPMVVPVGAISVGVSTSGALTIQNGSRLTSTGSTRLAIVAGSTGTVTVTGPGSQWNVPIATFYVGFSGTGILNIENGGQVTTGANTVLGGSAGPLPRPQAPSTSAAAARYRPYPFGAAPA